jgi:membrane protease YdiL (CAAX protease family)
MTTLGRKPRVRALLAGVAATALALALNTLRAWMGWDRGPLHVSAVAFLILLLLVVALAVGSSLDRVALGLVRPRPVPTVLTSLLVATVFVGCAVATSSDVTLPSRSQALGGLGLFALCTAPAEELLFRGVVQGAFSQRWGNMTGGAVSAASFALVHVPVYGWMSFPLATVAGLLLAWSRWATMSLVAPWAAHTAADCALLLL